jgi:hypothetical protein
MQDPPNADDLLEAIADFLEQDVLPEQRGRTAFHTRVAANLCRILARESRLETDFLEREAGELRRLLGSAAEPASARDLRSHVRSLNEELASRIRRGEIDCRKNQLIPIVKEQVRRKLLVARPDYIQTVAESSD